MATQGVAQPLAKKRRFLLRDLFKLCRSIARFFPRSKPNHTHKSYKHEGKIQTESKRDAEPKFHAPNDPLVFNFQEAKVTANKVEGVNLCKVHSYRFDDTSFVGSKKSLSSLSRNCSHRSNDSEFLPTLMRSTTTSPSSLAYPILYSSSSAKVAKPPPTEEKLSCTLEELCNGCTKKIKIQRDVFTTSGQMSKEEEIVEIKVKPGWKGGTKVTFESKGNEAMRSIPADLTFVIVEKDHDVFKREGDNLEMAVEVSLLEALTGFELSVSLLDGDNISLKIEDIIHPDYVAMIQGKGMPNPKEKREKERGDLRIRFRTKFPNQLTNYQRAKIQRILQDSS